VVGISDDSFRDASALPNADTVLDRARLALVVATERRR
jgi:hypothetical protein